jgi:hypothetical protein
MNPRGTYLVGRGGACGLLAVLAAGMLIAGCQQPVGPTGKAAEGPADEVARMATDPNVVNVIAMYNSTEPWVWNEDRSRVRGVYIAGLYLLGPKGFGVFGDGTIRPKVYVLEKAANGKKQPKLVKEWALSVEQSVPLRGKQRRTFGWGYGLPLDFGDLDLTGREIQILIFFERSDGRMVTSGKATFVVPRGNG